MDDFDLRDLLMPPLRYQSDLPMRRANDPSMHMDRPGQPARPGKQVLAMACVPVQVWEDLYEPAEGFTRGTIFRQLDLPFEGGAKR